MEECFAGCVGKTGFQRLLEGDWGRCQCSDAHTCEQVILMASFVSHSFRKSIITCTQTRQLHAVWHLMGA